MPKKKQHVELSDPNLPALSCGSLFHLLLDALQQLVSATVVGATWRAGDRSCQHDLADRGPARGSRTGDRGWNSVAHISSSGRSKYLEASRGGSTALALTAPIHSYRRSASKSARDIRSARSNSNHHARGARLRGNAFVWVHSHDDGPKTAALPRMPPSATSSSWRRTAERSRASSPAQGRPSRTSYWTRRTTHC
ncbi:hypothetical protein ABIC08_008217 [Bradyrhizobium sp. RT9b]